MYALVDCNSFFCSVEKVFHPGLEGRPVCVLSSNDGCIVALTPEAKALGLRRGDPLFRVRGTVEKHGVAVFSSNMMLYAAMSKRVTHILRQSVAHVENYSIDESFCFLDGYEAHHVLTDFMRGIARKIQLYTDIPVSVGIAPTKTLAKTGSKFAKKYKGYGGVCAIDTDEKRRKALALTPLSDIWGIGRHTLEKLAYAGVTTPLQLADKSRAWVYAHLAKPGIQTWMELNGTPCIDTAEAVRNRTLCTSRSFGQPVSGLVDLKAAVASFAGSCAGKLRGQDSAAQTVTVFIGSNPFRTDLPQYANAASATLLTPTSDTMEITQTALQLLQQLFRPGILYKKAGVALSGIVPASPVQADLFDPVTRRPERARLMKAADCINRRYGVKTLQLAVEGERRQAWKVKCECKSPNYLTDINQLLTVKA